MASKSKLVDASGLAIETSVPAPLPDVVAPEMLTAPAAAVAEAAHAAVAQIADAAASVPVPGITAPAIPVPTVPVPTVPVPTVAAPTVAAATEKTQVEVKATMEKAMKTAEEFVTFSQGNLEAFVKSGQIWAAGMQDITKQMAATAQAQMDHTVATFKALAGVKSLKEAVELQTGLARASVEKAVAETGKLTDVSIKLAEQTIAPITARVTLAVEKFGRPA